jgi:hypothetical protein
MCIAQQFSTKVYTPMKSMKIASKVALAAALLASTAGVARADLTINGEVGLPLNPTAQIPQPNGARVQGHYYQLGDTVFGDIKNYGIGGAIRAGDRFEVNGGVSRTDAPTALSTLDKFGFSLGGKYLFSRETEPAGVRLALGAGYNSALFDNIRVYGVASKYLGTLTEGRTPITGHLGVRADRYDLNIGGGGGGSSTRLGAFAGVEVPFTRDGALQFVGEVGTKTIDGGEFPFSAGLRYRMPGQGFSASIGAVRQGLVDDTGFYAQIGYSFATSQAGP